MISLLTLAMLCATLSCAAMGTLLYVAWQGQ